MHKRIAHPASVVTEAYEARRKELLRSAGLARENMFQQNTRRRRHMGALRSETSGTCILGCNAERTERSPLAEPASRNRMVGNGRWGSRPA